MNKLLKRMGLPALALATLALWSCSTKYEYETVPNDPLQARIYTLDNGLKVYMSVNKDGAWAARTTPPKPPAWPTTSNT